MTGDVCWRVGRKEMWCAGRVWAVFMPYNSFGSRRRHVSVGATVASVAALVAARACDVGVGAFGSGLSVKHSVSIA